VREATAKCRFHVTGGEKCTNTGMNKFSHFLLIGFTALTLVFALLTR
jgi:hypothetical protein